MQKRHGTVERRGEDLFLRSRPGLSVWPDSRWVGAVSISAPCPLLDAKSHSPGYPGHISAVIENCSYWVLSRFAKTLAPARRKFAAFVAKGEGEGHREAFYRGGHDSRVLGDDRFLKKVFIDSPLSPGE